MQDGFQDRAVRKTTSQAHRPHAYRRRFGLAPTPRRAAPRRPTPVDLGLPVGKVPPAG
jgi:hypothetical protein